MRYHMDGGFNTNPFVNELEENGSSPEIGGESPPSTTTFADQKSTSSPKRSRRSIQKRVVSIPIKDVEGSRLKGESAPPSDSWAWRKYGQKPIKGSPYPRGYYRCSSSKGCPARKQVERSRVDPTMLVITYSCEHNHPWPASRNHHQNHQNNATATTTATATAATTATTIASTAATVSTARTPTNSTFEKPDLVLSEPNLDEKFATLSEDSLAIEDEFGWFTDMASTSSTTILENPIFAETSCGLDADVAMFFPIKEEDESLFADLGELPECSVVFRRGLLEREQERRCTASPWCGTT